MDEGMTRKKGLKKVVGCYLTVSSEAATFRPEGNSLFRKLNNSKWLQEVPETDEIH